MKFSHHSLEFIKVHLKFCFSLIQEIIGLLLHVGNNDTEPSC